MIDSLYPKYYLFAAYGDDDEGGGGEEEQESESPPSDLPFYPEDYPPIPPTSLTPPPPVTPVTPVTPTPTAIPYIPPAPIASTVSRDKKIYKINIFKDIDGYANKNIPPDGAVREIEVLGTPGATFSLTIDKGDGCSMLTSPIDSVTIPGENGKIGKYTFIQRFPPATSEQTYDIQLTPSADVKLGGSIPITTPTYSIKQYVNPVVTFTNSKTDVAVDIPTVTTVRGNVGTYTSSNLNYATSTASTTDDYGDVSISWTIDRSEGESGYLYVKKQPALADWSNNVEVTKVAGKQEGNKIKLEPHTVDIEDGMVFTGDVSISKLLVSSEYVTSCEPSSNSLVLFDVDNLKVGMSVTGDDIDRSVYITAVEEDCKKITISRKEVISNNSLLTFVGRYYGIVEEVIDHDYIKTVSPMKFFTKTTLIFNHGSSTIISSDLSSTSGVTSPVISGTMKVLNFGKDNITFTQDLDNILTYTPNAFDQNITVSKNTLVEIDVLAPDTDENFRVKTPTKVTDPSNGALSGSDFAAGIGTIDYTPTTGYVGPDSFTFRVNDGTTNSDTKTIYITVK